MLRVFLSVKVTETVNLQRLQSVWYMGVCCVRYQLCLLLFAALKLVKDLKKDPKLDWQTSFTAQQKGEFLFLIHSLTKMTTNQMLYMTFVTS